MNIFNVRDHQIVRNGLLDHKATVTVENYTKERKEELVGAVSVKCGYHPLGYGIYGKSSVVSTGGKDEYLVYWRTGTHCD